MSLQLEKIIGDAWENRANINNANASPELRQAVEHVIAELDAGRLRVATRSGVGKWSTHQWIKKAVLLSFRLSDNVIMKSGDLGFYDKVPTKFARSTEEEMKASGVRVVPPAVARRGSFIAKDAFIRERRCVRGRRHNGRYVGHRWVVRPGWQRSPSFGRGRSWRSSGTGAG
jgi:2,3,4,5-tetrahydropyridine-2-carboxylate N-succinyltransferase